MTTITRTSADNPDFQHLVKLLNADLAERDGEDHPLAQFNPVQHLKYVVMAYENNEPIACGAIAEYNPEVMEIKRMYVKPKARGKRIGEKILAELELWVKELGNSSCVLFMGSKQPEAYKLYQRCGYQPVPKYGKLLEIEDCLCFGKEI